MLPTEKLVLESCNIKSGVTWCKIRRQQAQKGGYKNITGNKIILFIIIKGKQLYFSIWTAAENAFLACNHSTKLILSVTGSILRKILTQVKDGNCELQNPSLDKSGATEWNLLYLLQIQTYKHTPPYSCILRRGQRWRERKWRREVHKTEQQELSGAINQCFTYRL